MSQQKPSGTAIQLKRPKLSRASVLTRALDLIEEHGVDAASMRRLASELGVEAMSLYNHVRNKDELFDGVIELMLSRMTPPPPAANWRENIRGMADAFRQVALDHPNTTALMLSRQVFTVSALGATGAILNALGAAGFTGDKAVLAARSILAYQVGSVLREILLARPRSGVDQYELDDRVRHLVNDPDPMIASNANILAQPPGEQEYRFGLNLLIEALEQHGSGD